MSYLVGGLAIGLTVVWLVLPPLARFLARDAARTRGPQPGYYGTGEGAAMEDEDHGVAGEWEDYDFEEGDSSASKAADSAWFAAV